ncbi:growth arrest-specific protein 2-like [Dendronephthya gigantea]|uniref:growth arrest-specific protein 2-like n=1 Tax=Dendronephthya gigantea TaxID=151771 RepID=UPI00106A2965|nr:growth arrest-specific protein 2-like [Dendronephthya gigantea]
MSGDIQDHAGLWDETSALDISACIAEKAEETLAPLKEDLVDWLKKLFEVDITVNNFMEFLDNGVLVSKVAEMVHCAAEQYYQAGKTKFSVPRYEFRYHKKAKSGTFFARDNVAFFLDWCRCFGVSESVLFESDGLVMHKQPREVVLCLLEVARLAANYGIEPPGIVNLEKEIDEEIANYEKEAAEEVLEEVEMKCAKEEEKVSVKQTNNNVSSGLSLDKEVSQLAKAHGVKIKKVKEGRYVVEGRITIFVRILRNHVMVRVGGGWDTLDNFLSRHDASKIGRILTSKAIK